VHEGNREAVRPIRIYAWRKNLVMNREVWGRKEKATIHNSCPEQVQGGQLRDCAVKKAQIGKREERRRKKRATREERTCEGWFGAMKWYWEVEVGGGRQTGVSLVASL